MSRPSPRVRAVLGTSLLAFVFGYAGVMKIISGPEATYLALVTAGVGDAGVIKATGWLLPILEMTLAAWLMSGLFPVSACRVCAFVLGLFTSVVVMMGLATGWSAPCTCTGSFRGESTLIALIRNVCLLGIAIWLARESAWQRLGRRTVSALSTNVGLSGSR